MTSARFGHVLSVGAVAVGLGACGNVSEECVSSLAADLTMMTQAALDAGSGSSYTFDCMSGGTAQVERSASSANVVFSNCVMQGDTFLLEITSGTLTANASTIMGNIAFLGGDDTCSDQVDATCDVSLGTSGSVCTYDYQPPQ